MGQLLGLKFRFAVQRFPKIVEVPTPHGMFGELGSKTPTSVPDWTIYQVARLTTNPSNVISITHVPVRSTVGCGRGGADEGGVHATRRTTMDKAASRCFTRLYSFQFPNKAKEAIIAVNFFIRAPLRQMNGLLATVPFSHQWTNKGARSPIHLACGPLLEWNCRKYQDIPVTAHWLPCKSGTGGHIMTVERKAASKS